MALYETITLDGLTITGDPTQTLSLEAFDAPPPAAKPEWISAADSEWAALSRNPLHENREITLRIRVKSQTTMDAALDQIGQVRDKLRKASLTDSGIAMTWTPAGSTRTVTFDVLLGEIKGLPISPTGDDSGWFQSRPVIPVTLTAKPYWRGSEQLTSTASSGTTPFATMDVTSVPGDIPALARLIVTDSASQSRRFVEWGIENQYYPGSGTPSLMIDSDNMVVTGFSGTQTSSGSGAYDPNATGNSSILTNVFQTMSAVCGTGAQSHVGTFRVWVRAQLQGTSNHRIRLTWRVGDGSYVSNAWAATPARVSTDWSEIDLGLITIPPALVGTQRWDGRIEMYDARTETVTLFNTAFIDYLQLVPAAEGYGVARATYSYMPGLIVARDEFSGTTAGGTLNTRVAPTGGTWATSGATTDFIFSDAAAPSTQERIQRSTVSDSSGLGRLAILGSTNYTDVEVGCRVWRASAQLANADPCLSVIARYVDSSNFLFFDLRPPSSLTLSMLVAGAQTDLASTTVNYVWGNTWYRLRLIVFASGRAIASLMDDNANVIATLEGSNPALATGGTLATGKPGLRDRMLLATPSVIRLYDDFYASTPATEPVALYNSRTAEFRHDTTLRQDSGGTYYGRPQSYRGSRFLVSPGTSRVVVRARRNDPAVADANNVLDATTIQVGVTPRGLVVPR